MMNVKLEVSQLGYELWRNKRHFVTGATVAYKTTPANAMGSSGWHGNRASLVRWIEQVKEIRAILEEE